MNDNDTVHIFMLSGNGLQNHSVIIKTSYTIIGLGVYFSALRTDRYVFLKINPVAAFTHPSDNLCRIAQNEGMIGNVFGHNGSGTYKGVSADGIAANYGRICPDGGTFFDQGSLILVFSGDVAAGIYDIGKNHGRAAKYIVFKDYTLINGYIVLNLDVVSDFNLWGNNHILPDVASISNFGP